MMRKKCLEKGHKWQDHGIPLPYLFCSRWRCDASAVSRWAPPTVAEAMHNAIPKYQRVPPVEMRNGRIVEEWPEGSPS